MKQISAIFLIIITLISTTGLIKLTHDCTAVNTAIRAGFTKADCDSLACCSLDKKDSPNCCESDIEFIVNEVKSDFSFSVLKFSEKEKPNFHTLSNHFNLPNQNYVLSFETVRFFKKPPPKKQNQNPLIAFASFLC